LSVKPEYVELITKGEKKYEFRKSRFRKDVKEVFVYATKPVMKVVLKFKVGKIIVDTPWNLWKRLRNLSGLSEAEFFSYFKNVNKGVAIEIKNVVIFPNPIALEEFASISTPPQSWMYLSDGKDMDSSVDDFSNTLEFILPFKIKDRI